MGMLDKMRVTGGNEGGMQGAHGPQGAPGTVQDPVCKMWVDPAKTPHTSEHAGATVHFCSAGCKTRFDANPAAYKKAA
jgi:P-type Cu+ transporter